MISRTPSRLLAIVATLMFAGAPASTAGAAAPAPKPPHVTTGAATHVLATSALLTGTVNPEAAETSYYFKYGLTKSFGLTTPPVAVGNGEVSVRVGQAVAGLTSGATYYYRIVATSSHGTSEGRESDFKAKGAALSFVVNRHWQDIYGSPLLVTGSLAGFGASAHRVELQASPFPYLEPFAAIGAPATTNSAGTFSFRVTNLITNTQLRVATLDLLPLYSPILNVSVSPRVSMHVKSSSQPGVVRVYGTITPAVNGAKVSLQVLKAVRPGLNEQTTRWVGQFTTTAKRNSTGSSRFSIVVKIRRGGRYRVFVKPPGTKLAAGPSATTVVLHSPTGK
jgi:hypothetical protein